MQKPLCAFQTFTVVSDEADITAHKHIYLCCIHTTTLELHCTRQALTCFAVAAEDDVIDPVCVMLHRCNVWILLHTHTHTCTHTRTHAHTRAHAHAHTHTHTHAHTHAYTHTHTHAHTRTQEKAGMSFQRAKEMFWHHMHRFID